MSKIAILADIHLGHKRGPGLEWALDAVARAVEDYGAEYIVILGDLVDRRHPEAASDAARLLTACLSRAQTHFIAGNHDVLVPLELPAGVVNHGTDVHTFLLGDTTCVTAAVAEQRDNRQLFDQLPPRTGQGPWLGLLHTSLHGEWSKNACLPGTVDQLLALGYDAWMLGHVHQPVVVNEQPPIAWVGQGSMVVFDSTTRAVLNA